jgi:hypothetical protein
MTAMVGKYSIFASFEPACALIAVCSASTTSALPFVAFAVASFNDRFSTSGSGGTSSSRVSAGRPSRSLSAAVSSFTRLAASSIDLAAPNASACCCVEILAVPESLTAIHLA